MRIGNVEIYIVSDGIVMSDSGGIYGLVPRTLWEKVTPPDAQNRIAARLNCLLVLSQGKKILVDTGLGSKLNSKDEANYGRTGGSVLQNELLHHGFSPVDIDIVINTHLHADHCGGNTRREANQVVPTFPRAEYWIQRLEWADAAYPNERTRGTYLSENYMPLGSQVRLLDSDIRVTDQVRCIITRGHTRAHQSVLIESGDKKVLFLGDIAGRAVYMERLAWIPAYDVEPLETLETKRRIRDWAVEENILLIFQHDHQVAMGYMRRDADKFMVEPEE